MLSVLKNTTFTKLFSAQIVALLGTGLLTVALGLLAFDIAGGNAGVVMGTALTIKMVAYVAVSPITAALTARLPRKPVLISADLVRAGVAVALPFVTEAWQIYVLIFLLQSASATFTPAFQAVIPEVLPDEREYTRALSLSRLAYDLESLVSPMIAAILLTVISYNNLFVGTVVGFLCSTMLVALTAFPNAIPGPATKFFTRLTLGVRVFWARRELRSLLALNLVVATSTAMVIVNTVVLVQGELERTQADVALLLAKYGAGSMVVALALPRLLDKLPDRRVMLWGAALIPTVLLCAAIVLFTPEAPWTWGALMLAWFMMGAANSLILTPSARLLRRNSDETNRPAVFAAQFSLSHASFMITYPLAGLLGAWIGLPFTALILVAIGVGGAVWAILTWNTSAAVRTGGSGEAL
ncbi:MFS transporter [Gulosibacter chungangensis]|uniref:MFS transporter n=1 Tax=Gulosibacter chungangensis TaxID=979746 RepID=A0A7J5B8H9_9MICO|nr:MFS transporter [Gulosibacter chungangensis]KAB1641460.1 MFS transporter [Gulosibacter chungangensis]